MNWKGKITDTRPGKHTKNYGNHHFELVNMGKSTISTGPFPSSQTVNVYHFGYIARGLESHLSPVFLRSNHDRNLHV